MVGKVSFFKFIRKSYHRAGIRPLPTESVPFGPFNFRVFLILFLLSISFAASTAFLILKTNSFDEYGSSYFFSSTELAYIVGLLAIVAKMTDIFVLMDKFEKFVEKRYHPSPKAEYSEMDEKIERISKLIYSVLFTVHIANNVILFVLRTAANYFIYDLGDESYYLRWSLNWKTPIGYLIVSTVEIATDVCGSAWFIPTICFINELCWLSVAFVKDIESEMEFLNTDGTGGTSNQSQAKLTERFCEIVQLYADARQLRCIIDEFSRIFESIPTAIMLWGISILCIPFLQLQLELSKPSINLIELVAPVESILGAIVLIYLLCEFGESVTKQYELFDDELCKCDWYLFPIEMQRMYVIFMSYTQHPVMIRGYGNVRCVRESFKKMRFK